MLIDHRRQSERTTGNFHSTRTNITAGSTRTNITAGSTRTNLTAGTAGTVLTAGTDESFRGKTLYEAPKRLNDTRAPGPKKHVHALSVDRELERVLERMDSATGFSSRNQSKGRSGSSKKNQRPRRAPTRMFGFFRRGDGSKTALPVKVKPIPEKKSNKETPAKGKGLLVSASASLQKKQYAAVAPSTHDTLSRNAVEVFKNKSKDERKRSNSSKDKPDKPDKPKKPNVERSRSGASRTKKPSPSSEEELLGSILMVPSLNDGITSQSVKTSSKSLSTETDSKAKGRKNRLKKQMSSQSLAQSWSSSGRDVVHPSEKVAVEEVETSFVDSDEQFGKAEVGAHAIPAPPCLQVTTSMSSASEWKTTVSTVNTNDNGETFRSPLKSWSTAGMMNRNGTPFLTEARPKLSTQAEQLSKTDLIEDSDSSVEDVWAPPLFFGYTTSMSSANSSHAVGWKTAYAKGNGTPFGVEPQRGMVISVEDVVPPPPLVALSSLSLKKPQRKKSLSTRADSPPTLQYTKSVETVNSRWSFEEPPCHHATPPPPAMDHHQTNEITLPGIETPASVMEVGGKVEQVRSIEQAIFYLSAEATSSSDEARILCTECCNCRVQNFHVYDAAYVLCGECRTPTETNISKTKAPTSWGVGLGFSAADRKQWLDALLGNDH